MVLTPAQERLVALREGAFLLVAPPGSGKTEVLAQRIVRLVLSDPNASYKVLALSFTKAAAATMRNRVRERLGEQTSRVLCTNYHSFGLDVLRHYGQLIGLPAELTLYDSQEDRVQALKQGLIEEGFLAAEEDLPTNTATEVLEAISRLKRDLETPDGAPEVNYPTLGITLADAYRSYELALRLNGAVDFDGILMKTHELLCTRNDVASQYRRTYKYILIDEAQDSNAAQYEVLKALCGESHRNVFMVADPAQSIYAFSGASSKFVELFEEEFNAKRFDLDLTFRCAAVISDASKLLLGKNGVSDTDRTRPGAKGQIVCKAFQSEDEEASAVINWASKLSDKGLSAEIVAPKETREVPPNEIAILGRSRKQLRKIVSQLEAEEIPFHFSSGEAGPFDTDEFKVLLYGLKLIANSHDQALPRALAAFASKTLLAKNAPSLEHATDNAVTLLIALRQALGGRPIGEALSVLVRAAKNDIGLDSAMDEITAWDPAPTDDSEHAEQQLNDLEFLKDRWIEYKNSRARRDLDWHGMILQLVNESRPPNDGVRVLTVHAAKGLAFRAVAVIGMNEGVFPDFRNTSPKHIESERRLMYVAVTRAARVLWLSRARTTTTRFGQRLQEPSRFLQVMELPASTYA